MHPLIGRSARALGIATLLSLVLGLLLVAVLVIPDGTFRDRLLQDAPYPNYPQARSGLALDQFSECVALSTGVDWNGTKASAWTRALRAPTLGDCERIRQQARAEATRTHHDYWRYWHGYQLISRPMLSWTGPAGVRAVVTVLWFFAAGLFLWQVARRLDAGEFWALFLALLTVPLYSQFLVVSHVGVWVVAFLFSAWVLQRGGRVDPTTFAVAGVLAAFLDLLTVPLVSLTIPLLCWVWMGRKPGALNVGLDNALVACAFWAVGFIVCWGLKWAWVAAVEGPAAMAELVAVIAHRLGGPADPGALAPSAWDAWVAVLRRIAFRDLWMIAALFAGLMFSLWRVRGVGRPAALGTGWAAWLLVLALPFAWLALLRNHSVVHEWYVAPVMVTALAQLYEMVWVWRRR